MVNEQRAAGSVGVGSCTSAVFEDLLEQLGLVLHAWGHDAHQFLMVLDAGVPNVRRVQCTAGGRREVDPVLRQAALSS